MPVWKGDLHWAISTARSLKRHEPDIPIFFSSQSDEKCPLEDYGDVFYGGLSGWHKTGKRIFIQMHDLVRQYKEPIIKLDPDAYCLKPGGVAAIEAALKKHVVVGSVGWGLSLGGVVAMSPDFIEMLYNYPYQECEDRTRTKLLKELDLIPAQIPELVCSYRKERFPTAKTCFTHPFKILRKYDE